MGSVPEIPDQAQMFQRRSFRASENFVDVSPDSGREPRKAVSITATNPDEPQPRKFPVGFAKAHPHFWPSQKHSTVAFDKIGPHHYVFGDRYVS